MYYCLTRHHQSKANEIIIPVNTAGMMYVQRGGGGSGDGEGDGEVDGDELIVGDNVGTKTRLRPCSDGNCSR